MSNDTTTSPVCDPVQVGIASKPALDAPATDLRVTLELALTAMNELAYSNSTQRAKDLHAEASDAVRAALAQQPAALEPVALSDERIDAIADTIIKGMPDGVRGFCASWGYRQFARALLEDCRGHYRAALADAPAPDPLDMPLPCDITIGHGTHRAGSTLGALVARMRVLYDMNRAALTQQPNARALFEANEIRRGRPQSALYRTPAGHYEDDDVERAWETWHGFAQLGVLPDGAALAQQPADEPYTYDGMAVDEAVVYIAGDDGEEDSVTVLGRVQHALEKRFQGATVWELMERLEAAETIAAAAQAAPAQQQLTAAARDVLAERQRQISAEGWTPEHDDGHGTEELAFAAACYSTADEGDAPPAVWPWAREWWKPRDRRLNAVKAAALLLAEIERLDRSAAALAQGDQR